jgi:SH3-like domain-containing protein
MSNNQNYREHRNFSQPKEEIVQETPVEEIQNGSAILEVEEATPIPPVLPAAPENEFVVEINVLRLNCRRGPSVETDVAGIFVKGDKVTISEQRGNWGKVLNKGWINLDYTIR